MVGAVPRYQVWPSENRFHCGGRGISGPDRKQFYFSVFLLFAPEIVFLAWVIPELFRQFVWAPAILIVNLYLFSLCAASMFIAAFMDPGIIPRRPKNPEENDPVVFARTHPESKVVDVGGERLTVKFCWTCHIYRPPRATHCGICENCVDKFDHHCPYLGNCVGRRNYAYFLVFIYTVFINGLYLAAFSGLQLGTTAVELESLRDAIIATPGSVAVGVFAVAALLAISVLNGLHCYLAACNITTNENIKSTWSKRRNPFSRGLIGNCAVAFCPPRYPPALDPRELVSPDTGIRVQGPAKPHHNVCVCTKQGAALIELPGEGSSAAIIV